MVSLWIVFAQYSSHQRSFTHIKLCDHPERSMSSHTNTNTNTNTLFSDTSDVSIFCLRTSKKGEDAPQYFCSRIGDHTPRPVLAPPCVNLVWALQCGRCRKNKGMGFWKQAVFSTLLIIDCARLLHRDPEGEVKLKKKNRMIKELPGNFYAMEKVHFSFQNAWPYMRVVNKPSDGEEGTPL